MTVKWDAGLESRLRQAAARGVVAGTELLRTEAISLILETQKTGRIYRRGTVTHQASAPGEPPASDTGRLVNSIRTDYSRIANLEGVVNASTHYAEKLEYGTPRIEPRPFMRPALANKRAEVERVVRDAVATVLR